MAKGFTAAYFISPSGEIIYSGGKHIDTIIQYPEKFGLNKGIIEYVYKHYGERMGQEGKAREQLILTLLKSGWIRLRRYGDNFWSVNVKNYTGKSKSYLQKWARAILKGTKDFKEYDKEIPIKIDQESSKVVTSSISNIASGVDESSDHKIEFKNIKDLDNLPLQYTIDDIIGIKENVIDKIDNYIRREK